MRNSFRVSGYKGIFRPLPPGLVRIVLGAGATLAHKQGMESEWGLLDIPFILAGL